MDSEKIAGAEERVLQAGEGAVSQERPKPGAIAALSGRLASKWASVSPRLKGILLLAAAAVPAGAAGYFYQQWKHPYLLSVWMWVPLLLFPASIMLAFAGAEYLRGRRENVIETPVALPGSDASAGAKVGDIGKWLNLSTVSIFACRVGVGWTFWWGATEKHPWNSYGWLKDWLLRVEVMYTPFPWYRDFLKGTVAPNFETYALTTFIIELLLGITLFLGIGTRLAGLLGAGWGAVIFFGNWNVPGEPFWILALIFLAPLGMAGTRAGRALGVDMLLQPKLARNRFRIVRWVAKWTM